MGIEKKAGDLGEKKGSPSTGSGRTVDTSGYAEDFIPREGDLVWVRPCEARFVRTPSGNPLSAMGDQVSWQPFWQRRLDDGDIEFCAPDKAFLDSLDNKEA